MRVLPILLVLILMSSCSKVDSSSEPMMESGAIELSMTIKVAALDEGKVVLTSVLVNNSQEDLVFLPWNTPFDSAVTGRFLSVGDITEGQLPIELKYMGPMAKRRAPVSKDYLVVKRGETIENDLDITNSYKFCSGRNYLVRFLNDIFDENSSPTAVTVTPASFKAGTSFSACD